MGFLSGKKILVTGVITERSIAFGVAKALAREGADIALTYQIDKVKDRAMEMAKACGSDTIFQCDVSDDAQIKALADNVKASWGGVLDGFVHSIAYAPKEGVGGDFVANASREAFRISQDISAYSLVALTQALLPMMEGRPASIVSMTYLGSQRAIPNYNMMGVAKASLEAANRYLAACLGPKNIRVNALSPGPIRTTAAAGISGFGKLMQAAAAITPLRRNVSIDEVGNAAAFLLSDLASAITGQVIMVDGGYSIAAGGEAE